MHLRVLAIFAALIAIPANARVIDCTTQTGCSDRPSLAAGASRGREGHFRHHKTARAGLTVLGASEGVVYLPHPPGCPYRLFCACGGSYRVFGRSIRSLWPVSAWYRFPRAAPAPGRAALRPGHMFILERQVAGDIWTVSDYNSGGHLSRLHEQSIRGFTIVDPLAGKVALQW